MYCLVLNGNPEPSGFDEYLEGFARGLEQKGHETRRIDLRAQDIKHCTGCWMCWWGTPGLCALKDGMAALYPEMVRADLVVWASPLILGTISALTKKVQDRFIPLVHPYIEIVDGECHHRARYEHNADVGLIIQAGAGDGTEDIASVRELFTRYSKNTRTKFRLFATSEMPLQEAVDEALTA